MVTRGAGAAWLAAGALAWCATGAAEPPRTQKAFVTLDFLTASPSFNKDKHTREARIGDTTLGAIPYEECQRWSYFWTRFHRMPIPDLSLVQDGMRVSVHNLYGYVANIHVELVKEDGSVERSTVDTTRYTDIQRGTWEYSWYPLDTTRVAPPAPIISQPLRFGVAEPQTPPGKGLTHGLRVVRLKRNTPATALGRGGQPAALLVAADGAEGRALAEWVARRIREAHGVDLPIKTRAELQPGDMARWNTIFLGPPVDGLYEFYVRSYHDAYGFGTNEVFVGGDGHGGLGRGVEVLLARLTSKDGVVELPRVFELKTNDYVARSGEEAGDVERFALLRAEAGRAASSLQAAERVHANKAALSNGVEVKEFWTSLAAWVERYYISGDRRFLDAARLGYLALSRVFEREKDRRERYRDWQDDVHACRFKVMAYWDMVEQDADWTDAERLAVTQALLRMLADPVTNIASYQFPPSQQHGPRWAFQNHESGGPLAGLAAWTYFAKHYPTLEWVKEWQAEYEAMMGRQMRCYSTNENSIGYQFYGLNHIQLGMDFSHDKRYLFSGNLFLLATEHLMKHDNLGQCSARVGGEGGVEARPGFLELAADLCGARPFAYLGPRMRMAPAISPTQPRLSKSLYYGRVMEWTADGPAEEKDRTLPVDHVGIKALFLDEGLYHEVMHSHYGFPPAERGGRAIPRARALNKLSFRSGFHPDDDYLLIDGWGSRGAHSTCTGNAIVSHTSNRRLWLTRAQESAKEDRRPEINNLVTVVFNGADNPPSPYTGLDRMGDFTQTAIAATSKVDYNHCDWRRWVFQVKNQFFVVGDQVAAKEEGLFDVKAHWHLLGRGWVDGNRARMEQNGDVRFDLVNVSGHMQRAERLPSFVSRPQMDKTAGMYPFVEPGGAALSLTERRLGRLRAGEEAWAVNAFYSYRGFEGQGGFEARPLGATGAALRREGKVWLVAAAPVDAQGLKANGLAHVLSEDGVCGLGVTEMSVGARPLFQASAPVGAEVLTTGKAVVIADQPVTVALLSGNDNRITLDGESARGRKNAQSPDLLDVDLEPGRHVILFSGNDMRAAGAPALLKQGLAAAFEALPETRLRESEPEMTAEARRGLDRLWGYAPEAPARDVAVSDLDGDGAWEVLAACGDGRLVVLNAEGKPRFEFATGQGKPVNCVAVADVRGKGEQDIVIGSDDRHVYLLDRSGRLVWKKEPTPDFAGAYGGDAREDPGRKIVGLWLFAIGGKGPMEVYAATELKTNTCGQHICLDATGKQVFSGWGFSRYYPVSFMGRFVMDGKPLLLVGRRGFLADVTDKPADAEVRARMDGVFRMMNRETPETRGLRLANPVGRTPFAGDLWALADLDGDGAEEIVTVGPKVAVMWFDAKGKNAAARDQGQRLAAASADWRGGGRGLAVEDLDGDGRKEIVVASEQGYVEVWRFDKAAASLSRAREVDLFDEVTCLAVTRVGGESRIVAGAAHGLYVLDGAGAVKARVKTGYPAAQVAPGTIGGPAVVARERDVEEWRPDGRRFVRPGHVAAYRLE